MIDNNFFVNTSQKGISKKNVEDSLSINTKNISNKDSGNSDVESARRSNSKNDVNNGFNKILTKQKEKDYDYKRNPGKNLDCNKVKDTNPSNKSEITKVEKCIEKIEGIIDNEENFQGNKIDGEALEEIVALLNQIINSPEIKSIVPIKLEDPMLIPTTNFIENNEALTRVNNEDVLRFGNIQGKDNEILIDSNKIGTNLEVLKSLNNSKEALNLTNTILETLNSKNVEGILSSEDIEGIKNVLEGLVDKIFESDSKTLSNVAIGIDVTKDISEKIAIKDVKFNKLDKKTNDVIDEVNDDKANSEVKNIITDLKASLSSDINTTIKQSEVSNMDKIGSAPGAIEEEDKVLAKILGSDSISGSLNRQEVLIDRLNIKAPDATREPIVVNKETMDADIIKNVKFMIKNQVSELKVKIYPKELGEMTIKLLSEEGILKADIKAVSKETYNLLNSNINDIKKSLEQQNIKIHEVNIGLYSDDTTYHSGENNSNQMFEKNDNNKNRQGEESTNNSRIIKDDFEDEANIYDDNSVDLLV